MSRSLEDGVWYKIGNEQTFNLLKKYGNIDNAYSAFSARVQMGEYAGPGWYMALNYQQKCPRGCCYDSVVEVLTAEQVVEELEDTLSSVLSQARAYANDGTKTLVVSESDFDEIIGALYCFMDDRCGSADERNQVRAVIETLESQR